MIRRIPTCKLYYATTGKWQNDQNLTAVIESGVAELLETDLFDDVEFIPCGSTEIQKYYRQTKNKLSVTINFINRITLPDINEIEESYFGLLPFSEFKKLIMDSKGNLYNVFYDNVRDFQGDNPVNRGISKTLQDKKFDLFCVLNNGVTIVAQSLTATGNKFTLRDYQIVNGCQTSHVLYQNMDLKGIENLNTPTRIIVTDNDEIRDQITLATNSQTEIKPEQLEAKTLFQKNLEQYFATISGTGKLYYERRSQQYHSDSSIPKTKIITIPIQIKAFASMFLQAPHLVSGYFGTIIKKLQTRIFSNTHQYSPYYTSSLAHYRLETLFRTKSLDTKYKKARYHLLMIARILANPENMLPFNSKKIDSYCQIIVDKLNDSKECSSLFCKAIDVFDKSGLDITEKQFKSESQTKQILNYMRV